MPCEDDGSIQASENDLIEVSLADIEGSLILQDELTEELHEREDDEEYDERFSELVYDHDNFYSDFHNEKPYDRNNPENTEDHRSWLEKLDKDTIRNMFVVLIVLAVFMIIGLPCYALYLYKRHLDLKTRDRRIN